MLSGGTAASGQIPEPERRRIDSAGALRPLNFRALGMDSAAAPTFRESEISQ